MMKDRCQCIFFVCDRPTFLCFEASNAFEEVILRQIYMWLHGAYLPYFDIK